MTDCDQAIVETALAAPAAGFGDYERYPTLAAKAAVLLYTLAKSQACIDGNKRVALILVYVFADLNYARLSADQDRVAEEIEAAAMSDREERDDMIERLREWLGTALRPLEDDE